jgi:hypothetical protein
VRPTTSRPTSEPTNDPSRSPVTSFPTKLTEKDKFVPPPSGRPSVHPSYNFDYFQSFIYKDFLSTSKRLEHSSNSFVFPSFFFKGYNMVGDCNDWSSFIVNSINIPFDYVIFYKVLAVFESFNYQTKEFRNFSTTCTEKPVIQGLMQSLQSGITFEGFIFIFMLYIIFFQLYV